MQLAHELTRSSQAYLFLTVGDATGCRDRARVAAAQSTRAADGPHALAWRAAAGNGAGRMRRRHSGRSCAMPPRARAPCSRRACPRRCNRQTRRADARRRPAGRRAARREFRRSLTTTTIVGTSAHIADVAGQAAAAPALRRRSRERHGSHGARHVRRDRGAGAAGRGAGRLQDRPRAARRATTRPASARRSACRATRVRGLRIMGQLIDVGMLQIPRELLWRPGTLTAAEFELVKTHAERGFEALRAIEFPWPVAETVRQHHERLDGSGYPRGLQGRRDPARGAHRGRRRRGRGDARAAPASCRADARCVHRRTCSRRPVVGTMRGS